MRNDASGSDDSAVPSRPARWRVYAWGLLAVLTCPCHLPLLAGVLAGTTVGTLIAGHWVIAVALLGGLFIVSLAQAILSSPASGGSNFNHRR